MTPTHPTVTELLLPLSEIDDRGVYFEDSFTSWRDHIRHGAAIAAALRERLDPARPPHVGVLLQNTPFFSATLVAGALSGIVPVGLNPVRRGAALAGDIAKADCQLVLTGSGSAEVPADVEHINVDSRMDRRGGRTPGYRGAFSIRGSRRPFHADLHLGHQRRPEGGEVQPPQGCDRRRDDHAALQSGPRRRLLRLDAVVPFQRGAGRLGGGCGLPRLNGVATQIFGVAVPGRRPPLWRHLRQLRGQASFVCACDTGASRRRG